MRNSNGLGHRFFVCSPRGELKPATVHKTWRNPKEPVWNDLFAERTHLMKRSAVRELLKVAARPDIISLAGGLPATEFFPLGRVRQALKRVLSRVGPASLQYSETEGIGDLRNWIARRFSQPGKRVGRENVLITSGAQQALDLIGRVFLNKNDSVIVENPTYLALLASWRTLGVTFLPVSSGADGMQVESLDPLLNRHPKLIYLVPNFQNPQGTTLSFEGRKKLVALCAKHGIPVVEDNPYGDLCYEGESLPHLFHLGAAKSLNYSNHVLYVGTFSKVLMPGLRLGWVIAPAPVIDKLTQAKQAADLHTSTLNQHLAFELLTHDYLERLVPELRRQYRLRRDAMLTALEQNFPTHVSWTRPNGGMFLLLTFPEHMNMTALLPQALKRKIAYVPGEEFHLDGQGRNTLRLNFSHATTGKIAEGISRLSRVFKGAW